ncbi:Sodium-dependent phosphate transporter [Hyphomicrobiales bacterium]|nr:Sodium-dependent phosphate transporter [Hyphomicrobiales bacterium]CAH1695239.1 Sodium-dependent phosphate transporter [Hyphomicrobiales bacterium]
MNGVDRPGGSWRHYATNSLAILLAGALAASFWQSRNWTTLCAGLALFLFGMQCLEEGLRNLAGEKLESMLARGTATRFKSLMIGIVGTTVLQSSTLVSLMTIAFITTGLIGLVAGIAIIFGANLGATTGIWLLALAGQNFGLAPLAMPLMIFGVLASFMGPKAKASGRILLGIAFILLGIDQIRTGFSSVTETLDLAAVQLTGWLGSLVFLGAGLVLTLVLQSTHATLMLTLTALSLGQIDVTQGAAIAIGANVGSSVTTGLAGALGGNRSGQQLALAHVLFNVVTAVVAFVLLPAFLWLTKEIASLIGFAGNDLIMLAIFHSLFNGLGVALFWPLLDAFAGFLRKVLPEQEEPHVLLPSGPGVTAPVERTRARYLTKQALSSPDTAASAVVMELQHLGRLGAEVICHALYLPVSELDRAQHDEALLASRPADTYADAETLYQRHIKGVYGDLLSFMGRIDTSKESPEKQNFWTVCQVAALQLVETVKDAKHLQKNLGYYLRQPDSPVRRAYVELRRQLITVMQEIRTAANADEADWDALASRLDQDIRSFEIHFRGSALAALRADEIDGLQLSSLLNDLGYVGKISRGLKALVVLRHDSQDGLIRTIRLDDQLEPLIVA